MRGPIQECNTVSPTSTFLNIHIDKTSYLLPAALFFKVSNYFTFFRPRLSSIKYLNKFHLFLSHQNWHKMSGRRGTAWNNSNQQLYFIYNMRCNEGSGRER